MPICDCFQSRGPLCMSLNCSDLLTLGLLEAIGGWGVILGHAIPQTCLEFTAEFGVPISPLELGLPRLAVGACNLELFFC